MNSTNKNHPFRKRWGQNFLADTNLLDKIARTIGPRSSDHFLEIGPGEGALTERIFPYVEEMAVVEIDPLLVKELKNKPIFNGMDVIQGDILLEDIDGMPVNDPVRVIGNIPYNITSPIIFWLIEQLDYWSDAHIMMQKEVADRLTANVNTKAYGRLTVVVGAYLNIDQCFTVKPDVFIPRPKVDSAIVRFTKKNTPVVDDDKYLRFNKLVSTAFSQRRKMLRNTLKGWDIPERLQEKIDFSRRPETLTIDEFASMV
ncbi:MAG: 16S rRNA (adenine(1518)-N(6)/adenine(1519)-N(6))-dimethyltransferase RsmA [Candidatus Marinimicrobia bacterium]|nr:16S rRNA (adenine(1518)-N(6)/adenine(1519)-N(6))-dimethyltransferase RsmA [Candidatus Neomarinimicrobiota bacterium]